MSHRSGGGVGGHHLDGFRNQRSGSGVTFDSNTTLGNLLPAIAAYRDAFYEQLIEQLAEDDAEHAARLQDEARRLRQPFGAARQHLNSQLTRSRASQMEHVRLASVFARMGHPDAAQRQIDTVPGRVRADALPNRLQSDVGPATDRYAASYRRLSNSCVRRVKCCIARSSVARWSILGTSWDLTATSACFRRWKTAFTITVSTNCWT